ncbi:uncharacterized protein HMPREF1541_00098 [Cyphellophora europaea CBS 101466]|uniref:Mid2 domain-containing protein n=1 Tax=Cyphellophora europaea (strain CBS 101466) TaxID=1220924 RepID=W2SB50_CYPE1|nr:uncharacterized protein HMPREF1541_00098 [Cyphellophora europaea CBS 101466]ETN45917.1 hypothetical protein HMPREF1541_00098 [Cyphellophora europaea CBS 101466]
MTSICHYLASVLILHLVQLVSPQGITVQDDWVLPARPDKAEYFLNGDKITIEWTSDLWTWFFDYAPDVDPTACDLWVTGWELHQYENKIAPRVNVQARTSIDWVIDIPPAELNATEWWVFRFAALGASTTLEGLQVSSPGFGVREKQQPPPPTSSTEQSSSTTTASATPSSVSISEATEAGSTGESSTGESRDSISSSSDGDGLSTGAKAGIGIGATVAGLSLLAAGWLFGRKKRGGKPPVDMLEVSTEPPKPPPMAAHDNRYWGYGQPPHYMAVANPINPSYAELETPDQPRLSELDGHR